MVGAGRAVRRPRERPGGPKVVRTREASKPSSRGRTDNVGDLLLRQRTAIEAHVRQRAGEVGESSQADPQRGGGCYVQGPVWIVDRLRGKLAIQVHLEGTAPTHRRDVDPIRRQVVLKARHLA